MGERAIAIIVSKDECHLYRSQWGGSDEVLTGVFESSHPLDRLCELEWQQTSTCPPGRLVEAIDFLMAEAVYLITQHGVAVLLPLWFGLPGEVNERRRNSGVLVRVDSIDTLQTYRDTHRRFKGTIHDFVRERTLSPADGQRLLRQAQELVSVTSKFQLHSVANIYN